MELTNEVAFVFQSVLLVVLFINMAFRMRGNYFVHGIMMIVTLIIGWLVFSTMIPSYMDSSFMQPYMSSALTFITFGLHTFLGGVTLILGTWLVALWRPKSTEFTAKSKRIWQSTVIIWVLAYVVGVLLYLLL
jgi:uncharacterized membrane protein YozB (DUF420 family)